MKYAVLLHLVDWKIHDANIVDIGDCVQICQFKGSSIKEIYESLCSDYGLDEGSPFNYGSYFLIQDKEGRNTFDIYHVYNDVARLCNILAIYFHSPVGMSRVLKLTDSLKYSGETFMAHNYTHATEFLQSLEMSI
ncbi:MAG TPA: hypothetical protein VMW91_11190, partial [Desulfosporosinus sp.]|nr:hypothetical protein [Desulfosporosinus sp.]